MVLAYALRRGDGTLSVMLLNRDEDAAHDVTVRLGAGGTTTFPGTIASVVQYSTAQYDWLDLGPRSHPTRDRPPARFSLSPGAVIRLPAMSLTVVTARLGDAGAARPAAE
jgi:hypothetical protein